VKVYYGMIGSLFINTFERAEKRLSTSMARDGSRQAILSWESKEKEILKSQAATGARKAAP